MEIEQFLEEDFIGVEVAEVAEVGIPENMFRNLIQNEPNVVNEFHLPANFFEDEEDIDIYEHNDIWNDPIYRTSGDEITDSAYS